MTTKTPTRNRKVEAVVEPAEVVEKVKNAMPEALDEFISRQRKALEETGEALKSFLPKEFQDHSRAAFKESVEGYRNLFNSIIDSIIDTAEKAKIEPEKDGDKK